MKGFFALFLAVVACLCLVQSTVAWDAPTSQDRYKCILKNRNVVSAIQNFCTGNKNLVVPSQRARDGRWSDQNKFSAWIRGKCKPAQWVPEEWCFKNFWNMCANMGSNNKITASYGDGGCQTWRIKQF